MRQLFTLTLTEEGLWRGRCWECHDVTAHWKDPYPDIVLQAWNDHRRTVPTEHPSSLYRGEQRAQPVDPAADGRPVEQHGVAGDQPAATRGEPGPDIDPGAGWLGSGD